MSRNNKDKKFRPWLWFFGLPILNSDQKLILYESVKNEKMWRKFVSSVLMSAMSGLLGVGMILIFISYDSSIVKLKQFGENTDFIINLIILIICVLLAACAGTVIWAYLMKALKFVGVEQIEVISRPFFLRRKKDEWQQMGMGPQKNISHTKAQK
jgi:hypothetical protein